MELKTVEEMSAAVFAVAQNQWPGVNYEDVLMDSNPLNIIFMDIGAPGAYTVVNTATGEWLELLANWRTGEATVYENRDDLIAALMQQVDAATIAAINVVTG